MKNLIWENIFRKEEKEQSITNILNKNKIFNTLSKKELYFVESLVHERHFRAGEYVFRQGEVGFGMYILAKGSVDITVLNNDLTQEGNISDKREILVTRLLRGDFFGELSLIEENGRRSASCIAAEDTSLIGFFKPDLMAIVQRSPATGVKIIMRLAEVVGRRLKATTDKISQLRMEMKVLTDLQKSAQQNYEDDDLRR